MNKKILILSKNKLKQNSIRSDEEDYQASKEFQWLKDNITVQGIQTPLAVYKDDESDKYLIIDGNRRFLAAVAIGKKEFPCIEHPKEHIREIQVGVNVLREPLKDAQKSQYLAELVRRTKKTDKEVMKITGIPYDIYTKLRALSELLPELQQLVNDKKIDYHAGHALKRLNEKGQKKFLNLIKGLNLKKAKVTRYVIRDILKKWGAENFKDGKKLYLKSKPDGYAETQRGKARLVFEKRVEEKYGDLQRKEEDLRLLKYDLDRYINFFRILFRKKPLADYFKEKYPEKFSDTTTVMEVNNIKIK